MPWSCVTQELEGPGNLVYSNNCLLHVDINILRPVILKGWEKEKHVDVTVYSYVCVCVGMLIHKFMFRISISRVDSMKNDTVRHIILSSTF